MMNTLYYGDNLEILRKHVADESVDLIYLDPPFNSNADYNVLFREQSGEPAQAQIKAFTDTWRWSEHAYAEFIDSCNRETLARLIQGFVDTLGRNDVTAYLVMMAPRLLELHRALKQTGSLYLHCDPSASHYLKLLLDAIFGPRCFRNEIVWKRTSGHGDARRKYAAVTDSVFFYTKTDRYSFNVQYMPYSQSYIETFYVHQDPDGRRWKRGDLSSPHQRPNLTYEYKGRQPPTNGWRVSRERMEQLDREGRLHFPADPNGRIRLKCYLDEQTGQPASSAWDDIPPIHALTAERLGYPTQKPIALLERIIETSSNEGDMVLDPFCGCGTAVAAAQKLGRRWIGIDVTAVAVTLIKARLADSFGLKERADYAVVGEPTSEADARALARKDRDEFQRWAVGLVPRAFPYQEKKGADSGIDGIVRFRDDAKEPKKCVIQVKSGRLTLSVVRDFAHVVEREGATLGLFICLDQPTQAMQREADALGLYTTPLGDIRIPRLQFRTVGQLLAGEGFSVPSAAMMVGIQQAAAVKKDEGQGKLF